MICKQCGREVSSLKGEICRACFMVSGIESERIRESHMYDLPKEYHIPVNEKSSTMQMFMEMSQEYQERSINKK